MKKRIVVLLLSTIVGIMGALSDGMNTVNAAESMGDIGGDDISGNDEEIIVQDEENVVEGDPGLTDEEWDYIYNKKPQDVEMDVSHVKDRFVEIAKLAIEYDGKIPFVKDKTDFQEGYVDVYRFRPADYYRTTFGMGYVGYIQWLYLNSFGYVPESVCDLTSTCFSHEYEVTVDELRTGDIGVYCDPETGAYIYGICIGEKNGMHVFSFESPRGNLKLFTGCNRMAYLASETDEYLCGNAPITFTDFFRPEAVWDISCDKTTEE